MQRKIKHRMLQKLAAHAIAFRALRQPCAHRTVYSSNDGYLQHAGSVPSAAYRPAGAILWQRQAAARAAPHLWDQVPSRLASSPAARQQQAQQVQWGLPCMAPAGCCWVDNSCPLPAWTQRCTGLPQCAGFIPPLPPPAAAVSFVGFASLSPLLQLCYLCQPPLCWYPVPYVLQPAGGMRLNG